MIKGIVFAVVLMLAGDLTLNQGRIAHASWKKLSGFMSASNGAVHNSLFSW